MVVKSHNYFLRLSGDNRWYHCVYIPAFNASPGASGATWTAPSVNTLGGYQLAALGQKLYTTMRVCNDWDAESDPCFHIFFEVNVDNTLGNVADVVDMNAEIFMKGDEEIVVKRQTLSENVTVGQSPQFKQFNLSFCIDYDDGTDPVDSDDSISLEINLDTVNSDIDDIIINHMIFVYQTKQIHIEVP